MLKISTNEILYSKDNIWIKIIDDEFCMGGLTSEALFELEDIVYVEFIANIVNMQVFEDESIAIIETLRASIDVISPVNGIVYEVNEELHDNPELITDEDFEKSWIFKIELSDIHDLHNLMDYDAYLNYIE